MSKFGYSYPAGAEYDPNAPYNQDAEPINNNTIKQVLEDYQGPFDFYRSVYKATECGPSIGMQIEFEQVEEDGFGTYASLKNKWLYCDDLRELGSWKDLDSQGIPITAISVSSIVEGSDAEVPPVVIRLNDDDDAAQLKKEIWEAIENVNQQACDLWDEANAE